MARNTTLLKQRNDKVINLYNSLSTKYKRGERWKVYRDLRNRFFITNRTIDAILRGEFDKQKTTTVDPNQLSILDFTN